MIGTAKMGKHWELATRCGLPWTMSPRLRNDSRMRASCQEAFGIRTSFAGLACLVCGSCLTYVLSAIATTFGSSRIHLPGPYHGTSSL